MVAPPRTALVGSGDYLDRGLDSPRVVALLRRRGNPQLPPGARLMVTLVERAGEMALNAARRVVVATGHAPDRRRG